MRRCRNCNNIMEDGMMFCPECGVKYISFDEQIYASESCPIVIAEQNMFLDDGRLQTVIILGNVGEKTISACAVRLKCKDAFGTELADTVVKYNDLSAESQTVFGDDKPISPADSDTRKIFVIVEMIVFEDGTKWNETSEELKPTNAYDAFKSKFYNDAMTEIWEELFGDKEQLKQVLEVQPDVILPYGITEIPYEAFSGCEGLTSITIPDSVTKISVAAFEECLNLVNVTLPNSVTCIETMAFSGCKSLTSITIPNSVTYIGQCAFSYCTNLTNVTIANPMCKTESGTFMGTPYEESQLKNTKSASKSGGCYVATCVYGSYDCPQVWTLRRYRDNTLAETWHGRAFIRAYYAISPTIVKLFGNTKWFRKMWKGKLDKMVSRLQKSGYESTPYEDRKW